MFFVFLILIIVCLCYKMNIKNNTIDKTKIIEISVIDKYKKIEKIHKNPEKEEYVLVDIVIDGNYYRDCGIRTKGQTIYAAIKKHKTNNYSYKVKLDYRNKR